MRLIDLVGTTVNRLTVTERATGPSRNETYWRCRCACGTALVVGGRNLRSGHTKSCGCYKRDVGRAHRFIPVAPAQRIPEYGVWAGIRRRCYDPRVKSFHDYGGRGIAMSDTWRDDFRAFYSDMGQRPTPGHSIDRIDNDGDYTRDNCRWATLAEQVRNKRNNRWLTMGGQVKTLAEWGRETGIDRNVISFRIRLGWTVERALTAPVGSRNTAPRSIPA